MIMSNDAFLILFLILIGLMTIIPLFLRKFKIPDVIALLLVGMLIGPNGFDLLGRLTPLLSFLGTKPDVVEAHSLTLINSLGSSMPVSRRMIFPANFCMPLCLRPIR